MTCSKCHWVEESFRKNASKVFECKKCGFKIDRDHNAPRNIFFLNGERCVGRLEPMPEPVADRSVEVISLLSDDDDDDEESDSDDGCTGWMWNKKNTAAG
jgi:hypothetical protein